MKRAGLLIVCMLLLSGPLAIAQTTISSARRVVSGVVYDRESNAELPHVAVAVVGTNIGTVTNADGEFTLKLSDEELTHGLKFSCVGYTNVQFSSEAIAAYQHRLKVQMAPRSLMMGEVTIYGGTPRELVMQAIEKIPENYSDIENLYTTFYRETVQKRRQHIAVSEAVMDLYKSPYTTRSIARDKVRLRKGRRLINHQVSDTLAVKIVGGPSLALALDVVKNDEELLSYDEMEHYDFTMEAPVMLDNRMQHVIRVTPRVQLNYALFHGLIHIDQERGSFSRVELELDMSNPAAASALLLHRKPAGLRFKPQGVSFLIGYRQQGEKSYLNYVRSEFRFKCDWRRRLFSSTYTALSEMVMVDREENPEIIRNRERFRSDQIFYDEVDAYADPDYWQDYNILEPTESLENAVDRLRKRNARARE